MLKEWIKKCVNSVKSPDVKNMLQLRDQLKNTAGGGASWILRNMRYQRYCKYFGCFIPISAVIGEGVVFPHGAYGVFISQGAKIGKNCTIFHQVTIGSNTFADSKGFGVPSIGDNVYIGAGAKIIGNVKVGNNVRIGANTIVVKDVPDNSTVVMPEAIVITHENARDNQFVAYSTDNKKK